MTHEFDPRFPTIPDLRRRARQRIPRFAFEYLDGGCNEDVNLRRNVSDLQEVKLNPYYLRDFAGADLSVDLLGQHYQLPFGVAPMGLQGLIWPDATNILAQAARDHGIPFLLSVCTTSSLERVAEITQGQAWFQLYHPTEDRLRDEILDRCEAAGYSNLVIVCDVPSLGFRPRDIRNGLSMPPSMSLRNFLQIATRPRWALATLRAGQPKFETLLPYMPKSLNLAELGRFMSHTFSGRLTSEKIAPIRDRWKGKLILKGVVCDEDIETAIRLGVDGVIVSNHGGRQLDAGESSIASLKRIASRFGNRLAVMMDSGVRSGPDIARAIACGAQFVFLGRPFMYGVAALGRGGGNHTISILRAQLEQLLQQLCCERIADLPQHLVEHVQ